MKGLKPCPFCGADEKWLNAGDLRSPVGYMFSFVSCRLCGGAMIDGNRDHCANDLYNQWNKRDLRNQDFKEEDESNDVGYGWLG